ncbi:MAG: hypothetical protein HQL22_05195 [Candidatus Omnitrophica bacterium]|nr:hypothetical protein [Candidatus Omnitrophota bacterium]
MRVLLQMSISAFLFFGLATGAMAAVGKAAIQGTAQESRVSVGLSR